MQFQFDDQSNDIVPRMVFVWYFNICVLDKYM